MAQLMADGGSMRTLRFREKMHLADAQNQAQIRLNQEAEHLRAHAAFARLRELIRLWGLLASKCLTHMAWVNTKRDCCPMMPLQKTSLRLYTCGLCQKRHTHLWDVQVK